MKNFPLYFCLLSIGTLDSVPVKAAPDAQIPVSVTSPKVTITAPLDEGLFSEIQVVELLKVIAKTCKVGVIIDENVSGIISFVDIPHKSAEEALQYVARNAGLQIRQEADGTYYISKKSEVATAVTADNLASFGFDLKLKLDKSKFKSGETIRTQATLSLSKNHPQAPDKALIQGLDPLWTLEPTIIALKDYSKIAFTGAKSKNSYMNLSAMLTAAEPQIRQFTLAYDNEEMRQKEMVGRMTLQPPLGGPYLVLNEPLPSGRYLYFLTYFSQASPELKNTIWSGHLASNILEFEVTGG